MVNNCINYEEEIIFWSRIPNYLCSYSTFEEVDYNTRHHTNISYGMWSFQRVQCVEGIKASQWENLTDTASATRSSSTSKVMNHFDSITSIKCDEILF